MSMTKPTSQMQTWSGDFGKEYTDRNIFSAVELDASYLTDFGVTRTELNHRFLNGIERTARILEVGCNAGSQLLALQEMGFSCLYGIELQRYAIELAQARIKQLNLIQGSAFDIPFKDGFFELVFTSGVLIHIHPSDVPKALKEIHRCTARYIWGFEYYSPKLVEVPYRGNSGLLWKTDFAKLYADMFPDLELVKEEKVRYAGKGNVDAMFLLRKR